MRRRSTRALDLDSEAVPARRWRILILVIGSMVAGAMSGGVVFYVQLARGQADLEAWHTLRPEGEYTAELAEKVDNLTEYVALEDRLFREIAEALNRDTTHWPMLSRLDPNSPTNPASFPQNWNRTYRLDPDEVVAGALLLHGLSDSPYSLHAIAEHLQSRNVMCVGLRLPGHGGVPGGLTSVRMEDWQSAVRLAVRSLAQELGPSIPLILVGYSNGAALALDYTLEALVDEGSANPDRLIFFSPAFAVSRLAALARWQRLFSAVPGMEKLGWTEVLPEYDPFKFNSFPLKAGEEIYNLTTELEKKLQRFDRAGNLHLLPPVLSFQSVVDATVPPQASLSRLYNRLESNGSGLVLFDVDRDAETEVFLTPATESLLTAAEDNGPWKFEISVVTNRSTDSSQVEIRTVGAGRRWQEYSRRELDLEWPRGVYSLSHVAIPFPPDDPVYGDGEVWRDPFPLGRLDPRGEKGTLVVPLSLLMRLRYNPFYDVMPPLIDQFLFPDGGDRSIPPFD